jgi:tungstate transport system ATP-binding protein
MGAPMNAPQRLRLAPLVSLRDVSVRFGAVQALKNVSLELARGDFLALVGPNGSGKTTLLRTLHGMVAHQGTRVVADPAATQAMVYQRPFMLRLTVANNLRLALWLAGVPRVQWDATSALALQRVGLAELGERPARALSGGQQQRLALARAWAVRPSMLFLDEPTASLDPTAKREVEALLAGFSAEGMTLAMSTHNLGQAKRLASRVVFLEGGEVQLDLPTALFFTDHLAGPANLFLKGEMAWKLD